MTLTIKRAIFLAMAFVFAFVFVLALAACSTMERVERPPPEIVIKPQTTYIVPPKVICPETTVPVPVDKTADQSELSEYITDLWSTKRTCMSSATTSNKARELLIEEAKKDKNGSLLERKP